MRCLLVLPHGVVSHTTPHSRATLATAGTCVIRQVARPRLSYVLVCVSCAPCLATDARLSWQADHDSEVNALDFNPFNEFLLVTCSGHVRSFTCSGALFCVGIVDVRCVVLQAVHLWDTRKTTTSLHAFEGHTDEVFQAQWSPFNETVRFHNHAGHWHHPLAHSVCMLCARCVCVCVCVCAYRSWHRADPTAVSTCGIPAGSVQSRAPRTLRTDRRSCWCVGGHASMRRGLGVTGWRAVCLQFIHGGHTSKVSDFSWNENDDWVIASCAVDNIMQVWQMVRGLCAPPCALLRVALTTRPLLAGGEHLQRGRR